MTLRAEIVLAKGSAGHTLSVGQSSSVKRMMSRPEFAIYLAGLHDEPLWLVKAIYAGDASYARRLCASITLDLELAFCIHEVHHPATNYANLAAVLLAYYIRRGQCAQCRGTGRSKWHVRKCGACEGHGVTPLYDKDIAAAASIPRSSYSRRSKTYNRIIGRLLAELDRWHAKALAHIQRRIG